MNHPVLACRLGTRAPAPGCTLSPKPYNLHHVHTHAFLHSYAQAHSCGHANRTFTTSHMVVYIKLLRHCTCSAVAATTIPIGV